MRAQDWDPDSDVPIETTDLIQIWNVEFGDGPNRKRTRYDTGISVTI